MDEAFQITDADMLLVLFALLRSERLRLGGSSSWVRFLLAPRVDDGEV